MKKLQLLAKLEEHAQYLRQVLSNMILVLDTLHANYLAIKEKLARCNEKIKRLQISLGLNISTVG